MKCCGLALIRNRCAPLLGTGKVGGADQHNLTYRTGMRSDPAVTQLGFENFERQPKGLHQPSAFIGDSAVRLNSEAIAEFSMLLEVFLYRGVGDMCAERLVIGIGL